jgi:hypothetical protein
LRQRKLWHDKDWLKSLQRAQSKLRKLRARGVDGALIRAVMLSMGFGNVTAAELLKARAPKEIKELVSKVGRPEFN